MATLEHNLQTFQKIRELVNDPDVILILSGSTSLALRGIDLNVHDIDIVTDERGAKLLDSLLHEYRADTPLTYYATDKYRSWHARYVFNGCDIDVMGDFQYKLKTGGWSKLNHLHEVFEHERDGVRYPVLSLAQELQEYDNVGRDDKAAKIRATLTLD